MDLLFRPFAPRPSDDRRPHDCPSNNARAGSVSRMGQTSRSATYAQFNRRLADAWDSVLDVAADPGTAAVQMWLQWPAR